MNNVQIKYIINNKATYLLLTKEAKSLSYLI